MTKKDDQLSALVDLGFTATEAAVYLFLMQEPDVSGYRVSQALALPATQVYNAIESLVQKGAVIIADGKTKFCRALDIEPLLQQLSSRFKERRERAKSLLKDISQPEDDQRVYQIKNADAAYEIARQLIESAERVILADLFPGPAVKLASLLNQAKARGIRLCVRLYDQLDLQSDLNFIPTEKEVILTKTTGQHMSLVIDCQEFLSALLSEDEREIQHGFWSKNKYLSQIQHNSIVAEVYYLNLEKQIHQGKSEDEIINFIESMRIFDTVNWKAY
ncbi:MAG: hypothetical protein KDD94_04995 [Calditrichaeota bacterium]|nr:hypothetical protein [Calditrichota bacterium]